uniref:Uncharacterized protein n=1 Tax=Rhizophora mucronata TaxID=61149 RepID=A0A2P2NYL4_RHIMU
MFLFDCLCFLSRSIKICLVRLIYSHFLNVYTTLTIDIILLEKDIIELFTVKTQMDWVLC